MASAGFVNIQNVSGRRMRPARFATRKPEFPPRLNRGFWQQGTPSRWLFNEGAGATAFDIGNRTNFTIHGGISWSPLGMTFDGTSGYVSTSSLFFTSKFSAWCWVYPTASTYTLFDNRTSGGIYTWTSNGTNVLFFDNFATIALIPTPALNKWYLMAITWDGTNLTQYIVSQASFLTATSTSTHIVADSSHALDFGYDSVNVRYLKGNAQNLGFCPWVLTAAQLQQLYAQPYLDIQPRRLWVPEGVAAVPLVNGSPWPFFFDNSMVGNGGLSDLGALY